MEEQEARLAQAVEKLIGHLDLQHLRTLRKSAFLCQAACCDSAPNNEELQVCVDRCTRPVSVAEEAVSNELQGFQRSLSLCAKQCQDAVMPEVERLNSSSGGNSVASNRMAMEKLQQRVDICAGKCIEESLGFLPPLQHRLEVQLRKVGTSS